MIFISLLSIHDFKEKDNVMKQCLIFTEWPGRMYFFTRYLDQITNHRITFLRQGENLLYNESKRRVRK
jgi:hypothetical protein